jgi:hypothetical protein
VLQRAIQIQPGSSDDSTDEVLQRAAEEPGRSRLLEAQLKRARLNETEPPYEQRAHSRKAERSPAPTQQERLDHDQHQAVRCDEPLPRVVPGLGSQLVDDFGAEHTLDLTADLVRRRSVVGTDGSVWTLACSLGTSLSHRGAPVLVFGNKSNSGRSDLFPSLRSLAAK